MKTNELKKELMVATWTIDNEKDFLRYFENLLKSENLKVVGLRASDNIENKDCNYPFNHKRKIVNGCRKFNVSNKLIIKLSIKKTYIDNMAQSFDIEEIKIKEIK